MGGWSSSSTGKVCGPLPAHFHHPRPWGRCTCNGHPHMGTILGASPGVPTSHRCLPPTLPASSWPASGIAPSPQTCCCFPQFSARASSPPANGGALSLSCCSSTRDLPSSLAVLLLKPPLAHFSCHQSHLIPTAAPKQSNKPCRNMQVASVSCMRVKAHLGYCFVMNCTCLN